ncbi:type IA DNA topoisomerase [Blautia stercoris]
MSAPTPVERENTSIVWWQHDGGRTGEGTETRVWIDSQTEEEILRGIPGGERSLSVRQFLGNAAYLRAKEDYLMGINFSRLLSLKYGNAVSSYLGTRYQAISVGRVMTCVLGMVVRREREIRSFVKTPFYRVVASLETEDGVGKFDGEWRAVKGSRYFESPKLYKENGFKEKKDAEELVGILSTESPCQAVIEKIERKKENKNPPFLFNLAELQNECSRLFKISPDETLKIVQELYEKKLVTYPRTDARVLSTAVAKEIYKNLRGLQSYTKAGEFATEILNQGSYKGIAKTRYVNDKQITDHYAIIPTGQAMNALRSLSLASENVYETIVRRFLSVFYPPAVYQKVSLISVTKEERLFSSFRILIEEGYLKVTQNSFAKKKAEKVETDAKEGEQMEDKTFLSVLQSLKKGSILQVKGYQIKEGETSPPKRYTSGSMILAMENAGQLIEDEELRAQIKGSGIGTSATRAEILKKLMMISYLSLNKKTQVITPTQLGEMIFDVVNVSIRPLLNPELTASWEKGLTFVAEGQITPDEYMQKLEQFITVRTNAVLGLRNQFALRRFFDEASVYYQSGKKKSQKKEKTNGTVKNQ